MDKELVAERNRVLAGTFSNVSMGERSMLPPSNYDKFRTAYLFGPQKGKTMQEYKKLCSIFKKMDKLERANGVVFAE